jgi:hypothetical protein
MACSYSTSFSHTGTIYRQKNQIANGSVSLQPSKNESKPGLLGNIAKHANFPNGFFVGFVQTVFVD